MNELKRLIGGNAEEKAARIAADKAQGAELYPGLAEMEKEADDRELTDQELYDANPFPVAIDVDDEEDPEGESVEKISAAKPLEPAKKYGPFEIKEVRDAKKNETGRLQRSVRATLVQGEKRTPFLISCFDQQIHKFDDLEIGGTYNFRGYLRRKIGRVNGEKVLSFYLNLP